MTSAPPLVPASLPMQHLVRDAARWALRTSPLLLSGEAGTGKATLALAIHANGPRRAFPYLALDCRTLGHTAAGEPAHVSRWEASLQAELAQLDGNEQAAVDQLTPAAMAGPREPRPAGHLWEAPPEGPRGWSLMPLSHAQDWIRSGRAGARLAASL
jgi:hypothetical protein